MPSPLEEQVEKLARELNLEAGRQRGWTDVDDWEYITEQERGGWRNMAKTAIAALLPLEVTDRGGNVSCGRCGQRMAMCECPVKAEEVRHCAVFSSPSEAESFLGETQEVQVDRLARFFHSEFSSDRIAEWDDLEPLTQRIWNTEALRAYVFMLTGTNPLDELETAGPDQPGRPEGVADAPSGPSRDIAPKKEDGPTGEEEQVSGVGVRSASPLGADGLENNRRDAT